MTSVLLHFVGTGRERVVRRRLGGHTFERRSAARATLANVS